ncbi:DUF6188 family protein [Rhodococcoides fascians]|uniref:DUF6188 family protein n=1 Tax=Rhodococcoides fascians TaxID=1828 RepID=UPI0005690388
MTGPLRALISRSVTAVDVGCTLVLRTSGGYEILVESTLSASGSETDELEGSRYEHASNPLNFVGRVIEQARVSDDGALRLMFNDGTTLVAPADPDYEAWTISGPGGAMVVSMPGGGLAIWD